jgi:hypothetical protein
MFRKQSKIDQINVIERENIEGLGSKIFERVSAANDATIYRGLASSPLKSIS